RADGVGVRGRRERDGPAELAEPYLADAPPGGGGRLLLASLGLLALGLAVGHGLAVAHGLGRGCLGDPLVATLTAHDQAAPLELDGHVALGVDARQVEAGDEVLAVAVDVGGGGEAGPRDGSAGGARPQLAHDPLGGQRAERSHGVGADHGVLQVCRAAAARGVLTGPTLSGPRSVPGSRTTKPARPDGSAPRRAAGLARRRGALLGRVEALVDGVQHLARRALGVAGLGQPCAQRVALVGEPGELVLDAPQLVLHLPDRVARLAHARVGVVALGLQAVDLRRALLDLALRRRDGVLDRVVVRRVPAGGPLPAATAALGLARRRGVRRTGACPQLDDVGRLAALVDDAEPDVLQRLREAP